MYIGLHAKYSLLLSDFSETCIFVHEYSKNTQISNFMEIRPVGAELLHAVKRSEGHDEADSRISQFFEIAYKGNFNPYSANVENMVSS